MELSGLTWVSEDCRQTRISSPLRASYTYMRSLHSCSHNYKITSSRISYQSSFSDIREVEGCPDIIYSHRREVEGGPDIIYSHSSWRGALLTERCVASHHISHNHPLPLKQSPLNKQRSPRRSSIVTDFQYAIRFTVVLACLIDC